MMQQIPNGERNISWTVCVDIKEETLPLWESESAITSQSPQGESQEPGKVQVSHPIPAESDTPATAVWEPALSKKRKRSQ